MENIQIREIVALNINEVSDKIEQLLILCQNIQIFITDELFKRLLEENKSDIIWEELIFDGFHYDDKEERAFIFELKDNNIAKTVQMHFIPNSIGYMQVTFFTKKGIVYRHYLEEVDTILIISSD